MKEGIKVSYSKDWDCNGTSVDQSIRITRGLFNKYNNALAAQQDVIANKKVHSNRDMDILCFGKPVTDLSLTLTLTQVRLLSIFLNSRGIDTKRILSRNTKLVVVDRLG